jgi:hypothetical protein
MRPTATHRPVSGRVRRDRWSDESGRANRGTWGLDAFRYTIDVPSELKALRVHRVEREIWRSPTDVGAASNGIALG